MSVPSFENLFNPLLKALHQLGGSASVSEIKEQVAEILSLSETEIAEIHRGNRTKLDYNLAWARTYLKKYSLLENSERGVWVLTAKGIETKEVERDEVLRHMRAERGEDIHEGKSEEELIEEEKSWQDKLMEAILELSPSEFERLCQRILRESGFIQVQVTGKSGDGGIDGKGVIRLGGLIGFHVKFQCKGYSGSVSADKIRDFRGAMVGRADKGLFITTGTFTRDAKKEATREGAPKIDLIDGEQLIEKMKELGLGVKVKREEVIEIDKEWFAGFRES